MVQKTNRLGSRGNNHHKKNWWYVAWKKFWTAVQRPFMWRSWTWQRRLAPSTQTLIHIFGALRFSQRRAPTLFIWTADPCLLCIYKPILDIKSFSLYTGKKRNSMSDNPYWLSGTLTLQNTANKHLVFIAWTDIRVEYSNTQKKIQMEEVAIWKEPVQQRLGYQNMCSREEIQSLDTRHREKGKTPHLGKG